MKIVNAVLAIGTLIIVGVLIVLGIAAFYPAPAAPAYPNTPVTLGIPCAKSDTTCLAQQTQYQQQQDQYNEAETTYEAQMSVYDRNVFILANVVGIIVFVAGFFLVLYAGLASTGAPIGIMMAGLWSIIYGYGRGWGSIDDRLKFFIGLVVAVIVIGGSMWLMQRRAKRGA